MSEREFPLEICQKRCRQCGKVFKIERIDSDMMCFDHLAKRLLTDELYYFNAYEDELYIKIVNLLRDYFQQKRIGDVESNDFFDDYLAKVYRKVTLVCNGSEFVCDHENPYVCPQCGSKGQENFETMKNYKQRRRLKKMEYKKRIEEKDLKKILEEVLK